MKNKLMDLNNHLFAQLERLSDEEITKPLLDVEIDRSKAICMVAEQIIENANLSLKAYKVFDECHVKKLPPMIGMEGLDAE